MAEFDESVGVSEESPGTYKFTVEGNAIKDTVLIQRIEWIVFGTVPENLLITDYAGGEIWAGRNSFSPQNLYIDFVQCPLKVDGVVAKVMSNGYILIYTVKEV